MNKQEFSKRAQQGKGSEGPSSLFGNYFEYIGGSGSDLPNY